jgi:hypothetical protein
MNPGGHRDQDVYLKALTANSSVDHIEYGNYVSRAKQAMLAIKDNKGRPVVVTSDWPIMVKDSSGADVRNAQFMAQTLHIEEKGSDVNVATHLLVDVLSHKVDAAVVISNDSDLRLPIHQVRSLVPVGLVNPSQRQLAGALKGRVSEGVGRHWWMNLDQSDFTGNQLPTPVKAYTRPAGW